MATVKKYLSTNAQKENTNLISNKNKAVKSEKPLEERTKIRKAFGDLNQITSPSHNKKYSPATRVSLNLNVPKADIVSKKRANSISSLDKFSQPKAHSSKLPASAEKKTAKTDLDSKKHVNTQPKAHGTKLAGEEKQATTEFGNKKRASSVSNLDKYKQLKPQKLTEEKKRSFVVPSANGDIKVSQRFSKSSETVDGIKHGQKISSVTTTITQTTEMKTMNPSVKPGTTKPRDLIVNTPPVQSDQTEEILVGQKLRTQVTDEIKKRGQLSGTRGLDAYMRSVENRINKKIDQAFEIFTPEINECLKRYHDKLKQNNRYLLQKHLDESKVKYDKRNETLELLVQLQEKYKLHKDAYFGAVSIFDYMLFVTANVCSSKYELLAITAMHIVAKHEDGHSCERFGIKQIVEILNRKTSKKQVEMKLVKPFELAGVQKAEMDILKKINFELKILTPMFFVSVYLKYIKIEAAQKVNRLSEHVLEKFTLAKKYSSFSASVTALAALYVAVKSIEPKSLNSVSNFTEMYHEKNYFREALSHFYFDANRFLSNDVFMKYSGKNKPEVEDMLLR